MSNNYKRIREDAMDLPDGQRESLAVDLLNTLMDSRAAIPVSQVWLDEAAARADAVDRGKAKTSSDAEVDRRVAPILVAAKKKVG